MMIREDKEMYLEVKDVKKSYGSDAGYTQVLKGVTTSVEKGEMCVIQGTSGSGKSTLLNCIGGLDIMDSGSVKVDGTEIFGLKATLWQSTERQTSALYSSSTTSCLILLSRRIFRYASTLPISRLI